MQVVCCSSPCLATMISESDYLLLTSPDLTEITLKQGTKYHQPQLLDYALLGFQCSATCGDGARSRNVYCMTSDRNKYLPEDQCRNVTKPLARGAL